MLGSQVKLKKETPSFQWGWPPPSTSGQQMMMWEAPVILMKMEEAISIDSLVNGKYIPQFASPLVLPAKALSHTPFLVNRLPFS